MSSLPLQELLDSSFPEVHGTLKNSRRVPIVSCFLVALCPLIFLHQSVCVLYQCIKV